MISPAKKNIRDNWISSRSLSSTTHIKVKKNDWEGLVPFTLLTKIWSNKNA